MTVRLFAALFCLLCAQPVLAAETGYTYRTTEVKSRPFTDAPTTATLPERTTVEILVRKGAWMQIKQQDGNIQGWARMLSVRLGSVEKKSSNGSLLSLLGFGRRSSRPQTSATVTTGVRGFSEEDLKEATPNPEELKKMDGLVVSAADASKFAAAGKLQSQSVPYFDEQGRQTEAAK